MGELLERAKKVAEHKGMSMAQFQEKIGVSISHFYNTDKLSLKTKRAVSEVFPDINADWLETGEGFMTNTDKLQEEGKFYKVPLLPVAAQGGTPNNFEYQIKKHDCEMMISPIENISMAISVTGIVCRQSTQAVVRFLCRRLTRRLSLNGATPMCSIQ